MGKITIVGLGPGAFGLLTVDTLERLNGSDKLLLRTAKHPTVPELEKRGICYQSYDYVYEEKPTFDEVYQTIAEDCVRLALEGENIVYAVPGSPLVAEKTVLLIRETAEERGIPLTILPGMSFLEVLYTRLGVDPIEGVTVLDASDLAKLPPDLHTSLVVTQLYNRQVASEAKLSLMELYEDTTEVVLVQNLGLPDESIKKLPLFELDRQSGIDHLTSLYIPPRREAQTFSLAPLTEVMAALRSPGGCVWDLEQNHKSLRRYLVEEVYEVLEAIDLEDEKLLCEELGDLLLQIVFHARVAEESGAFTVQDVVDTVTEKMIRRHPHVFGDITVRDAAEVLVNWDEIKKAEKPDERPSVLDGVPKGLPSLSRAAKLQNKAAKVGFDWQDIGPVWDKIREEIAELKEAVQEGTFNDQEGELGDILFSVVNLARFLKIDPETALNRVNNKFVTRFSYIEQYVKDNNFSWEQFTLAELDKLWEKAKKLHKNQ